MDLFAGKVGFAERDARRALEARFSGAEQPYSIAISGAVPHSPESDLLFRSLRRALAGDSKLPQAVRAIRGMSGQKYRSFINNTIEALGEARYLEIGCWAGSTAAAALFGNTAKCLCIDNWSEFGGPKGEFFANMAIVRSDRIGFAFLEKDFRAVDFASIGRFNVYLFDGPHSERDQYDGIRLAQPALDDRYILIVDDWNWTRVREGTLRGLVDTRSSIEMSIEVRTSRTNTQPSIAYGQSDWHNGYFIALVRKAGAAVPAAE